MEPILSPGQERIREIVWERLPAYLIIRHAEERELAYEELREALGAAPIILADPITGQPLDQSAISAEYINWLKATGSSVMLNRHYPPTPARIFAYGEPEIKEPASMGGVGWKQRTMRELFNQAAGEKIYTVGCDAIYFTNSGILECGGGGRHRLLAQFLWGTPRLQAESLTIYEDSPMPQLNLALLRLKRFFDKEDSSIASLHPSLQYSEKFGRATHFLDLPVGVSSNEERKRFAYGQANLAVSLAQEASDDELAFIAKYVRSQPSKGYNDYIGNFWAYFNELRQLKQRSPLQKWWLNFLRRIDRSNLPTPLEAFLSEYKGSV